MGDWISVGDRLPDNEVLLTNGITHLIGYVNDELMGESEYEVLPGVTHWMPLPEPPNTDSKGEK